MSSSIKLSDQQLEKRPLRLKRHWEGAIVRTVKPLRNTTQDAPVGSLAKCDGYYRGLKLWTVPCEHCGVAVYVTGVPERAVEYVGHPVNYPPWNWQ